MFGGKAKTVNEYLDGLPPERREVVSKVRSVIKKHLPKGYEESVNWGIITYEIPLKRYPDTYNGQPLCYAGIAAQRNHYSLYLMAAYGDSKQAQYLEDEFKKIDAMKDRKDVLKEIGRFHAMGWRAFFGFRLSAHDQESRRRFHSGRASRPA